MTLDSEFPPITGKTYNITIVGFCFGKKATTQLCAATENFTPIPCVLVRSGARREPTFEGVQVSVSCAFQTLNSSFSVCVARQYSE